jgi:hypothetical protein
VGWAGLLVLTSCRTGFVADYKRGEDGWDDNEAESLTMALSIDAAVCAIIGPPVPALLIALYLHLCIDRQGNSSRTLVAGGKLQRLLELAMAYNMYMSKYSKVPFNNTIGSLQQKK